MATARREGFRGFTTSFWQPNVASDIVRLGESTHTLIAPMGDPTCPKKVSFMREPASKTVLRYGLAITAVAAVLVTTLVQSRIQSPLAFNAQLCLIAIAITFWYAGTGPGLVALVLLCTMVSLLIRGHVIGADFALTQFSAFTVFFSLLILWFSDVRRRAERLLTEARDNLERRVAERTAKLQEANSELQKLRKLEADLAHTNRLSMMGVLAASLAHEVKQPITAARNNAGAALNFLAKKPPNLAEVREALGCIVGDAERAGDIIDGIRAHTKKAPLRQDRFDVNKMVTEVVELARSAISKHEVSLQMRLAADMFAVQGDRVQVQQVILNLILNAIEAMSSVDGPRELVISTEQRQTNGVVSVRDSGPGIDPEQLERVFEAFYTTKSNGVGIGLSICRSIIDAHGGRLWIEANEPRGAAFQFTVPSAANELRSSPRSLHHT
jgi:C4-dicarboxylate-specific signal transduction histidine kinase